MDAEIRELFFIFIHSSSIPPFLLVFKYIKLILSLGCVFGSGSWQLQYLSFILLNTSSFSAHTCCSFLEFALLTSTLPLRVKGRTPGLLWIRYPPVATPSHSAPPHVATTSPHTHSCQLARTFSQPLSRRPDPTPDGKRGQKKTKKIPPAWDHNGNFQYFLLT